MSYTQRTLGKDETISSLHRPTRWTLVFPFAVGLALIGCGLGLLAIAGDPAGLTADYSASETVGDAAQNLSSNAGRVLLVIGLLVIAYKYIIYRTTEYAITNKKVLMKRGWIRRQTDELLLMKMEGVDVKQSILGRILGYGNLVFQGTGAQTVTFTKVPDPLERKVELQDLVT